MPDYDDPQVEEQWCEERRKDVADYLQRHGVIHGQIGEWPAWHVAPYVSIWAIESHKSPGWVGWWVISGDLPTDYISANEIKHPRDAMLGIASLWGEAAELMARGEQHPDFKIGSSEAAKKLAPLLKSRANTLIGWANDPELWEEDESEDKE